MDGNYIKIFRSMLDWEWWHDINTCRVFIFLLLKANWKDGNWKGVEVKRGSYISSLDKMAADVDLTRDELRTAIKHLKSTKEITTQSTRKYTVFTVLNYDLYQSDTTVITTEIPNKSPTNPTLIPLREEGEEGKKEKNNNIAHSDKLSGIEPLDDFFESIWRLYPVKKGKGGVSKTKKQVLQRIGYDQIKRCVERFVADMEEQHRDKKYWMYGSTFFNSGYVDYLDENYESREKQNTPVQSEPEESNEELVGDDWWRM